MFLTLKDGAVFEGKCLGSVQETAGFLSIYTGGFGYEEVITNPANTGKIMLFTFPIIGATGINREDNESDVVCPAGIICKEYSRTMSNFRAKETLLDFVDKADVAFGEGFDTRAILVHLREKGEQMAVLSEKKLTAAELKKRLKAFEVDYTPVMKPLKVKSPAMTAAVLDLGAGKSFFSMLADSGIAVAGEGKPFDVLIVSNAPAFLADSDEVLESIRGAAGGKPVVGFGDGAALAAAAAGYRIKSLGLGHHGTNIPVKPGTSRKNLITSQNHCYVVEEQKGIRITAANLHDKSPEAFVSEDGMVMGFCYKPQDLVSAIKTREE
ncbi:MAG: hypothetical protein IK083_02165 [Abditibacteriota bacterium]|nr:hypothetical protein [Abditibacteriota bacterium]